MEDSPYPRKATEAEWPTISMLYTHLVNSDVKLSKTDAWKLAHSLCWAFFSKEDKEVKP